MEQAVETARTFLTKHAGLSEFYLKLDELRLEQGTWTLRFRYSVIMREEELYLVQVDDERGEVVSFERSES